MMMEFHYICFDERICIYVCRPKCMTLYVSMFFVNVYMCVDKYDAYMHVDMHEYNGIAFI